MGLRTIIIKDIRKLSVLFFMERVEEILLCHFKGCLTLKLSIVTLSAINVEFLVCDHLSSTINYEPSFMDLKILNFFEAIKKLLDLSFDLLFKLLYFFFCLL
jgi:hypothetical protein